MGSSEVPGYIIIIILVVTFLTSLVDILTWEVIKKVLKIQRKKPYQIPGVTYLLFIQKRNIVAVICHVYFMGKNMAQLCKFQRAHKVWDDQREITLVRETNKNKRTQ